LKHSSLWQKKNQPDLKTYEGRDLYDLLWYFSDPNWPLPNLVLLTNALVQTIWHGSLPNPENWRGLIYQCLKALDWKTALNDVRPF
jgi:hypothetical protein